MVFDSACRVLLFEIAKKHGLHLEEEPEYGGRKYLEKQDFILAKQFDALVSLAFNIGKSALKSSTLLKKLNVGDYEAAAEQFLVWNKITVNGVKQESAGLTRRRKAERELFLTGTTTITTTTTEEEHDMDTLRNDDTGQQVTVLQKLLNQLGSSLSEGGIFGSKTEAAVESYQKKQGLTKDGICGPKTWAAILEV